MAVVIGWLLGHARPANGTVEAVDSIPWDDEPLTEAEAAHIKANLAEGGEPIPWAEVKARAEAEAQRSA